MMRFVNTFLIVATVHSLASATDQASIERTVSHETPTALVQTQPDSSVVIDESKNREEQLTQFDTTNRQCEAQRDKNQQRLDALTTENEKLRQQLAAIYAALGITQENNDEREENASPLDVQQNITALIEAKKEHDDQEKYNKDLSICLKTLTKSSLSSAETDFTRGVKLDNEDPLKEFLESYFSFIHKSSDRFVKCSSVLTWVGLAFWYYHKQIIQFFIGGYKEEELKTYGTLFPVVYPLNAGLTVKTYDLLKSNFHPLFNNRMKWIWSFTPWSLSTDLAKFICPSIVAVLLWVGSGFTYHFDFNHLPPVVYALCGAFTLYSFYQLMDWYWQTPEFVHPLRRINASQQSSAVKMVYKICQDQKLDRSTPNLKEKIDVFFAKNGVN